MLEPLHLRLSKHISSNFKKFTILTKFFGFCPEFISMFENRRVPRDVVNLR